MVLARQRLVHPMRVSLPSGSTTGGSRPPRPSAPSSLPALLQGPGGALLARPALAGRWTRLDRGFGYLRQCPIPRVGCVGDDRLIRPGTPPQRPDPGHVPAAMCGVNEATLRFAREALYVV